MILIFRKILSVNERFAYSLLEKIRHFLLIPFNSFLKFEVKSARKRLTSKTSLIRQRLIEMLPEVSQKDMTSALSGEETKYIILEAEKILDGDFTIFSKQVNFKDGIDWHVDFNSNNRWPKGKLYSKYNQVDVNSDADVKYPRELSRCHHFLYLGEAYILTKNERYTREFIAQVKSWILENPYKKSINWGCSMDIAIRASNWIYSLRMFTHSPLIDDDFFNQISTSLYLHGRFIYEHPEKNRVYNHNHYLSDLAGQILISFLFSTTESKEAQLWKKMGIYEFFREIRLQILPTGFTYERTTNYHRLVTELIAYTIILLKNNNSEIPYDINFRVKKMFEVIQYYSFSKNGFAPIIGDQDSGRFLPFYPYNINFQKYLINIGAVLFKDDGFKGYAEEVTVDALFLFGNKNMDRFHEIKPLVNELKSKPFSDAGFYVMRSVNTYVFINNSGLSHYNEVHGGTHTHSDLLSFVYAYNNIPFLVDPGTYVYSSDPKQRLKFRSTAMHNTITVDNFDQNDLELEELWEIKRDAIPQELIWKSEDDYDIYKGSHTGYERLQNPVKHERCFELDKIKEVLTITDTIECNTEHEIKNHLHFDENVKINIKNNVIYCSCMSENIRISFNIDIPVNIENSEAFVSKAYGHRVLAPYVVISFKTKKSIELITTIQK